MDDYAHCSYCDKVINIDKDDWTADKYDTFCGDCKSVADDYRENN